jgi:hypothetical protein
MQLKDVQAQFKDLMLDHPDALKSLDDDFSAVFESGNIALPKRLAVYRNNIIGSITDTVITTCPTLEKLVGRQFLEHMARSFVLLNPPRQGCLTLYGEGFDSFIAKFEPAASMAYLPDIARLDLAMNQSYYAPDQTPLTSDHLATITPEDLGDTHLKQSDHAICIQSDHPIDKIHAYCQMDNPEHDLDVSSGGAAIMVFRQNFQTQIVPLEIDEFTMLDALKAQPLGNALESTVAAHPDFNFQIFLQKHLSLETFYVL